MGTASEPPTQGAPVRRFRNPAYEPVAPTLGALRERIDALDAQIVELLAQRARCVRDATRFKADAFQVAAPARQAQVFQRIRALAQAHDEAFPGFADVVEPAYRTLVAGFVASEARLFEQTEKIHP